MAGNELNVLAAFLAVAEERSFTRAAKRLGVSQSALSHAIRGLEEQIGVRLLARTTRSVAPTDAGDELLAHLRPALADIRGALEKLSGLRDKPAGRVRLLVSPLAATAVRRRSSDSSRGTTRTSCSMSRPMTAASTLSRRVSTRAFISGSSLNRTWWP